MPELGEVRRQGRRGPTVNGLAPRQEEQPVQEPQDPITRLVYGHHDNASALSNSLEDLHHHEGAGGVEAGSRLVEEENDRIVDDVDSDRDTASFSAGDTTVAFVADDRLRGVPEAELVDESLDAGFLLGFGKRAGEAELGGEHERLFDCEHREEEIVLHDISRNDLQKPRFQDLSV